ncbi:MAG: ABC transporter substrate-binding protein [Ilumatobacteraceae bacterium]
MNIVSAPYMGIVNAKMAEANGATADADDSAEQWFLENSAGSGPFMLESYAEGDQLVLARNDEYWGDANAVPERDHQAGEGRHLPAAAAAAGRRRHRHADQLRLRRPAGRREKA